MVVNSSLDNLSESLNNLDLYDKINQYKLDDYFITHYKELIFDIEAEIKLCYCDRTQVSPQIS